MSDIKIQPSATGSATVTLTAPATSTARTVTLPDATGTLLNSDGSGANLSGVATLDGNSNLGVGTASTTNFSNYKTIATNDATGGMFEIMIGGARTFNIQSTASLTNMQTRTNIPIAFEINTTEKMRLTSDGLTFNGDTAAANALDDYEEGTWTAVFQANGSNITATYNSSQHKASYIKVGKMVTIFLQTRTDSISGSPSGNIQIAGLPFTKGGDGAAGGHCGDAYHFANNYPIAFTVNGDTIGLNRPDANKTAITAGDLRTTNDSNQIFCSFSYRIA